MPILEEDINLNAIINFIYNSSLELPVPTEVCNYW